MPKAASVKQQRLFQLANAVKNGKIPARKVTSNVRQLAKDASKTDLKQIASTKTAKLPNKVGDKSKKKKGNKNESFSAMLESVIDEIDSENITNGPFLVVKTLAVQPPKTLDVKQPSGIGHMDEEVPADMGVTGAPSAGAPAGVTGAPTGGNSASQLEETNLNDIIGRFSEHGKRFKQQPMRELAEDLANIAEMAESQLSNEDGNDWYDKHTIGRNIKEMKAYAKEFEKLAEEADEFNTRMQALYADMGRVLERYFNVSNPTEQEENIEDIPDDGETLLDRGVEQECGTCKECGSTMHESCTTTDEDITRRALPIVRKKLSEVQRIIFDRLPPDTKRKVIWRLI